MTRHRPKVGAVIQLALSDGRFAYGRVLKDASVAFYATRSDEPNGHPLVIATTSSSSASMTMSCGRTTCRWSGMTRVSTRTTIGRRPTAFAIRCRAR